MQHLISFDSLSLRLTSGCRAILPGRYGLLLALLLLAQFPAQPSEPQQVRFFYSPSLHDLRGYDVKLLQHALHLTQQQYGPAIVVQVPPSELSKQGEVALMANDTDIAVLSSKPRRNKILFQIPTPLTQGMLGYRLLVVTPESAKKFTAETSLKDLQQRLIGGVLLYWEDFRIYNHNKLLNSVSLEYQTVFNKLSRGEIDYFSRGLHEVFRELDYQKISYPKLTIAPDVALYYPFDYYFYTRSPDSKLTKRIMEGLAKAEKDGSLKQLFQQSVAEQIDQLKEINPKRVIYLHHPEHSSSDKFHYEWWLSGELPTPE